MTIWVFVCLNNLNTTTFLSVFIALVTKFMKGEPTDKMIDSIPKDVMIQQWHQIIHIKREMLTKWRKEHTDKKQNERLDSGSL